jgi:hypothetical protein
MQCKDIPTLPILQFLARHPKQWHNWYFKNEFDVTQVMPLGTPEKLVISKMRMMIFKKLVDGCPCGCRGDFVITAKGFARMPELRLKAFFP